MSGGVKIKWKGFNAFASGLEKASKKVEQEAGGIIFETALGIEKTAKKNAPYDTGFLRNNIAAKRVNTLTSRVDSFAPYSIYLEKGTRKMAAQPYFQPAINNESVLMYRKLKGMLRMVK